MYSTLVGNLSVQPTINHCQPHEGRHVLGICAPKYNGVGKFVKGVLKKTNSSAYTSALHSGSLFSGNRVQKKTPIGTKQKFVFVNTLNVDGSILTLNQ